MIEFMFITVGKQALGFSCSVRFDRGPRLPWERSLMVILFAKETYFVIISVIDDRLTMFISA